MEQFLMGLSAVVGAIADFAQCVMWIWVQGILQMQTPQLIQFVTAGALQIAFYIYVAVLIGKEW